MFGAILLVAPRSRAGRTGQLAALLAMLLVSVAALLGWARWQESLVPEWSGPGQQQAVRPGVRAVQGYFSARTDLGRTVILSRVERETQPGSKSQPRFSQDRSSSVPATLDGPETNCHGWVFTAGQYLIDGEDVDDILDDNGYTQLSTPQAGDLIVYRGPGGIVQHTGLVREVSLSGVIVVESKWGSQGLFRHAPEDQPHWESWSYYRSEREGHLLGRIEANSAPQSGAVTMLPGPRKDYR